MECHSSSATCEADNQSYTTDNSSIVYSNYESGRGSPSYQQVDQIHQRDNLPPTHIYDVKINDSKEVHLGDRNIYNIDNFQVNAEQRAKRKKQICCFWIFFGALGSGGVTSVALTVILAEPDPNFTTPEPEITTNMDTSSIMPDASSEANISKKLYDLIERVVWDSDFNDNNPPAGIKLSSPAERIFISATGGLPCADLDTCITRIKEIKEEDTGNGFSDVSYNFYIGGENLMIEGTGWTREADHTAPQFNSAIAFAFIGEYSNMDPDQIAIDAFLNFLQIAETDEGHNNLLPEEYILIAQRDLINTQNPGNALYALLKTWNNWSIDWEFYF